MNFLDIFLASILLFGFVRGLWKGFFVELASFISLIIGVFIAVKFSGYTANFIREKFSNESEHIELIAFGITFLLVIIGVFLLARIFTKIASFTALGWLNKLLGAVFGTLKILFILSIVLHFFQKINSNEVLISEQKLNESVLYNPVIEASEIIFPVLSEWFDKVKNEVLIISSENDIN